MAKVVARDGVEYYPIVGLGGKGISVYGLMKVLVKPFLGCFSCSADVEPVKLLANQNIATCHWLVFLITKKAPEGAFY